MATYSSDQIKKLQQALKNNYNAGTYAADGIVGKNTNAAISNAGYANLDAAMKDLVTGNTNTSSSKSTYNSYSVERPTYDSPYSTQLDDLYNQISNRKQFNYDMNADALYRQYAAQYQAQGNQAMQDTMAQAAGLTGGYANTYGQTAGQQAYNAYLSQLNDIVPELEQNAYTRYQNEGNDLLNQYNMLADRENTAYNKYLQELNQYNTDRDYAFQQEQWAYQKQQDALDRASANASLYADAGNTVDEASLKKLASLGYNYDTDTVTWNGKKYAGGTASGKNSDGSKKTRNDDLVADINAYLSSMTDEEADIFLRYLNNNWNKLPENGWSALGIK